MSSTSNKRILILFIFTFLMSGISSAESLLGSRVLVSNHFKGNSTDGVEVDVAAFGLDNNLFSRIGDDIELPGFITLYDVDLSSNSVSFDWIESEFSKSVAGTMPADKHDRNYFIFDLPHNLKIVNVELDITNSQLHSGSALPTVKLISPNKFMTEFASGVIRKQGFRPVFKVTTSDE